MITLTTGKDLLNAFCINHRWVVAVRGGNASAFPYEPKSGGKGSIVEKGYYTPKTPCQDLTEVQSQTDPLYLINIPLSHLPFDQSEDRIEAILELLRQESFRETAELSAPIQKQRLSVVIGINQIQSIDSSANQAFIDFMLNLKMVAGIAYRIFGFFWAPEWTFKNDQLVPAYPLSRAFFLLKILDPKRAMEVREMHETPDGRIHKNILSQIPFQHIRETIKNSFESIAFFQHYLVDYPSKPSIYYTVMDSDCEELRTNTGLFSRFDACIATNNAPSAVTFGYRVSNDERPIIRLGVQIDMAVREAMNAVIPFSPYFPEPCTSFRLRQAGQPPVFLQFLSFIGDGRTLENRRLIQNGLVGKQFDRRAVFIADGGVMMGTPGRMKTKKNEKIVNLTQKELKNKSTLQALRDISQTHATPKQWADNLYLALNIKCSRVTDVTTHLMRLFGVYDPINRMYSVGRFSKKSFDLIIDNYHQPLNDGLKSLREVARTSLLMQNIPLPVVDRIEEAAIRSGEAIYQKLSFAAQQAQNE